MYSYDLLKEEIQNNELTLEDLRIWQKDYEEVYSYIFSLLKQAEDKPLEEQIDFILGKLHHNNSYDICSDTSFEPIEYIDFNYGSLTCTISTYGREVPELLPTFDGYIRRNGMEIEGNFEDVDYKSVDKIIKESEV